RTLTERRDGDRKHREPKIEIFAILTRGDGRFQVAIRGGDDAHVDLQRGRATNPLEPLFFERSENLGLQRQRQIADFVEEQRAAVCQLELSRLSGGLSGERSFLVP